MGIPATQHRGRTCCTHKIGLGDALTKASLRDGKMMDLSYHVRGYAQVREAEVPLDDLKFSQPAISSCFRNGPHYGSPLQRTIEELRCDPNMVRDCATFRLEAVHCSGQLQGGHRSRRARCCGLRKKLWARCGALQSEIQISKSDGHSSDPA